MIKLAHIVNPVNVNSSSDLFVAQPVTFESMLAAKNYSKYSENIFQYTIGFEEDETVFPPEFIKLPTMTKSVLDTNRFKKHRKLPLIKELLNPLLKENVDYVVYTNVDIAVMPFFYDFIFDKLAAGSDSLIINRRVVSKLDTLSIMCSEIGVPHPGYDCFVFKKELLYSFNFENVCIGANWIGRTLIANLMVHSKKLEILKDEHLTFHIGDDGAWMNKEFSEFDKHNEIETFKVLDQLKLKDIDEEKKIALEEISDFMRQFGVKSHQIKPSIGRRIKNKLISYLE